MLDVRLVNLLQAFRLNQRDDPFELASKVGRQGPKLFCGILIDHNDVPDCHMRTSLMMLAGQSKHSDHTFALGLPDTAAYQRRRFAYCSGTASFSRPAKSTTISALMSAIV